jgi:hypothetical protein
MIEFKTRAVVALKSSHEQIFHEFGAWRLMGFWIYHRIMRNFAVSVCSRGHTV